MATQTTFCSAAGPSAPLKLPMGAQDWSRYGGISLLVNFSGAGTPGVGNVDVQVSNDPLAFNDPPHARWNNHDTLVSLTQDANDTIIAPIYAVRLNCSSYSSGTITLQIGYPDQI